MGFKRYLLELEYLELNFLQIATNNLLEQLSSDLDGFSVDSAEAQQIVQRLEIGEKLQKQYKKLNSIKSYKQKPN